MRSFLRFGFEKDFPLGLFMEMPQNITCLWGDTRPSEPLQIVEGYTRDQMGRKQIHSDGPTMRTEFWFTVISMT
ncbi:hypothetical protein A7K69_09140 [Parageobacillus thermoglucosidasius]|uniref:Uncharacterized protein n=1 Tax=Parageobacillus thermoglucosidasius TaxID=1426 RepID=A0A1B7KQC5_PARTM|nr:hypothetical protein A7K69_09140 [Parageobacillus thermoglucosidasius]